MILLFSLENTGLISDPTDGKMAKWKMIIGLIILLCLAPVGVSDEELSFPLNRSVEYVD